MPAPQRRDALLELLDGGHRGRRAAAVRAQLAVDRAVRLLVRWLCIATSALSSLRSSCDAARAPTSCGGRRARLALVATARGVASATPPAAGGAASAPARAPADPAGPGSPPRRPRRRAVVDDLVELGVRGERVNAFSSSPGSSSVRFACASSSSSHRSSARCGLPSTWSRCASSSRPAPAAPARAGTNTLAVSPCAPRPHEPADGLREEQRRRGARRVHPDRQPRHVDALADHPHRDHPPLVGPGEAGDARRAAGLVGEHDGRPLAGDVGAVSPRTPGGGLVRRDHQAARVRHAASALAGESPVGGVPARPGSTHRRGPAPCAMPAPSARGSAARRAAR